MTSDIVKKSKLWQLCRESTELRVSEEAVVDLSGWLEIISTRIVPMAAEHTLEDDMKTIQSEHMLKAFEDFEQKKDELTLEDFEDLLIEWVKARRRMGKVERQILHNIEVEGER